MMAYKAMTQEWLDAWKEKIAGSKEYKEIAKNWEGSVSIIVNPDPEKGIPEPIYLFTDYWHGDVRGFSHLRQGEGGNRQVRHVRRLRPLEAGSEEGGRLHESPHAGEAQAQGRPDLRRSEHQDREQGDRSALRDRDDLARRGVMLNRVYKRSAPVSAFYRRFIISK